MDFRTQYIETDTQLQLHETLVSMILIQPNKSLSWFMRQMPRGLCLNSLERVIENIFTVSNSYAINMVGKYMLKQRKAKNKKYNKYNK